MANGIKNNEIFMKNLQPIFSPKFLKILKQKGLT